MQRIKTENGTLVVLADVHAVEGEESERVLRNLLEQLSATDDDVMFLGDIMDLWIGLPKYECKLQRDFLEWCRQEKARRKIYFVEGNHEYYVAKSHKDVFFMASEDNIEINGVYFAHGHKIQGSPFGFNRFFCGFAKSVFACFIMRIMPFGTKFARWLKGLLGSGHKCTYVPRAEIEKWLLKQKAATCVLGHFHEGAEICIEQKKAILLPMTKGKDEVSEDKRS